MFRSLIVVFSAFALSTGSATSHEFWIDPVATEVSGGVPIEANIRVGEMFKGSAYQYLPPRFRRFDYVQDGQIMPVPGRVGDRPAATFDVTDDGLVTLIHVTTDSTLTYREFEKFRSFVEHKDATFTLGAHMERGLPTEGFKEVYSRYAKALVAVGDGMGDDIEAGLLTEIVALENPYTGDMSDGIDVRLLYQGAPRVDEQIEVYEKTADEAVSVFTLRTDADGVATVPVKPGHRYMLDAVVLREPAPEVAEETGAVWESLWANLTFGVPG